MFDLFKTSSPTITYFGKIVDKPSPTMCTLKDNKGRTFSAESDGTYTVGESVLVRNGVVVGRTSRPKQSKHFIV